MLEVSQWSYSQEAFRMKGKMTLGPDSVSITGNRVVVADGINTLTLTCTTQEYNRYVHITWYNGTTQISNTAAATNTSGSYGGLISTQVLQLTPDRYQDGNAVTCVVQNEDVTLGERTASVTLDINYLPSTPASVSVNPTTEGRERSTVDLTCQVTGGKPRPSLQWTCPRTVTHTVPTTGSQGDSHTSVITVTLTRQVNGHNCSCTGRQNQTSWTGSAESPVFIVRFGPDNVSITGNRVVVADGINTLTLTCTTQEYNRHVHITWYNGTTRISNTATVTNTSGSYGGLISTQVLQLTPDRYQDGNVVRCVVQNEAVTVGERTASVTLDINCK
ncbi:uncharacterized protein LOC117340650 [Pecten maximus]|uniref:uncharacterized protein LOC117340650 n=1 Tax=Pecten maximus TaxID=6579 RepID=UPI001457FCB3|nr:uncharacterized protein LOC117340650 [Pecten maximus]